MHADQLARAAAVADRCIPRRHVSAAAGIGDQPDASSVDMNLAALGCIDRHRAERGAGRLIQADPAILVDRQLPAVRIVCIPACLGRQGVDIGVGGEDEGGHYASETLEIVAEPPVEPRAPVVFAALIDKA